MSEECNDLSELLKYVSNVIVCALLYSLSSQIRSKESVYGSLALRQKPRFDPYGELDKLNLNQAWMFASSCMIPQ